MAHSSKSRPETEPQKGLSEMNMAAEVVQQLIQLFGDDDIDQCESSSTSTNKRKQTRHLQGKTIIKKRRYRSIDNLYMSTEPI